MLRCISCGIAGEKDAAENRDKQLSLLLKQWKKEEAKIVKLLLLGPGESGKSTITKQMKIIHINGFTHEEQKERIKDIKKNIRDSILSILGAMSFLHIDLHDENLKDSYNYVMKNATETDFSYPQEFYDHVEKLWADGGVQSCYRRSNEYQLIDCAKYFLDRISVIRREDYIPSNQDILRCRVMTNTIQRIDFTVPHGIKNDVHFSVFDVGGQRGERRKWLQVFDAASAILFLLDSSSFDLTLREDTSQNRMMEALETFEQVFNSRWLRYVSMILFINKTDLLEEKINAGKSFQTFIDGIDPSHKYYSYFQGFREFQPKETERQEFIESISHMEQNLQRSSGKQTKKFGRSISLRNDVNEEVVKTAVFIKKVLMEVARRPRQDEYGSDWHGDHTCEYYYTCAVDTDNIRKVMDGCRAVIIKHHLKIWGLGLS